MVLWLPGAELQPADTHEMAIAIKAERNELTRSTLLSLPVGRLAGDFNQSTEPNRQGLD